MCHIFIGYISIFNASQKKVIIFFMLITIANKCRDNIYIICCDPDRTGAEIWRSRILNYQQGVVCQRELNLSTTNRVSLVNKSSNCHQQSLEKKKKTESKKVAILWWHKINKYVGNVSLFVRCFSFMFIF